MKWISKHIWWILCTLALGAVLLCCTINVEAEPLRFSVTSEGGTHEVTVYSQTDGIGYVFLPSYAKMEQVRIVLGEGEKVTIGDSELTNGMDCGDFALETDYALKDTRGNNITLRFCQSANLPTVYINTATGSMEQIHKHKDVEESMLAQIYSAEGKLINAHLDGKIKGRGNTTWNNKKKPYALTLSTETDLFGMGKAAEWVLLANGGDNTNLRNKLIFELAKTVCTEWTPDCQFVDLYLNGEYNGLYLLTEKVETGSSRLDINIEEGDFLCKVELDVRWNDLNCPISTKRGRTIGVVGSATNIYNSPEVIEEKINEMEDALLSGEDLSTATNIDLDSWVRRYIIDEISGNLDSDCASSYFYCQNGVFYGGPIWDYDLTFFIPQQGHMFVAKQYCRNEGQNRVYYGMLYENQSFYYRVVELYEQVFLPALQEMVNMDIECYAIEIESSFRMDGLRWAKNTDVNIGAEQLRGYLKDRMAFLNSAWIDDVRYCSVQVEEKVGADYRTFSVKCGERFITELIDIENNNWYVKSTGEKFDSSQPVYDDIILVRGETLREDVTEPKDLQTKVMWASLLVCVLFLTIFVIVDIGRMRKGRRIADEK